MHRVEDMQHRGALLVSAAVVLGLMMATPGPASAASPGPLSTALSQPTITGLQPGSGPTRGRTLLTITGANLAGATAVRFGSASALGFRVNSPDSISALSPAGTGTVNVTVTTPGGTSALSTADQFTYATSGEWTIFPSPSLGAVANNLDGISCLSVIFCVAVGHSSVPGAEALIETWNGNAWSMDAAPATAKNSQSNGLNGVSCPSAKFCIAVGTGYQPGPSPDSSGNFPIIERWNGATWSQAEHVPINGDKNELRGVSCVSSSFCVAVGVHRTEIGGEPDGLVESWNGETWSLAPSVPVGEPTQRDLNGVSCVSSTFCVAVGVTDFGSRALVESWNGTEWAIVPGPNRGSAENALNGVSCVSSENCVAVGSGEGALVEYFNGSTWSIYETAHPEGSKLTAISCVSAGSCAAVGTKGAPGPSQTLVETSRGLLPSADGAGGASTLAGVSCLSAGSGWKPCFGVGEDEATAEGPFQTLVELGEI